MLLISVGEERQSGVSVKGRLTKNETWLFDEKRNDYHEHTMGGMDGQQTDGRLGTTLL